MISFANLSTMASMKKQSMVSLLTAIVATTLTSVRGGNENNVHQYQTNQGNSILPRTLAESSSSTELDLRWDIVSPLEQIDQSSYGWNVRFDDEHAQEEIQGTYTIPDDKTNYEFQVYPWNCTRNMNANAATPTGISITGHTETPVTTVYENTTPFQNVRLKLNVDPNNIQTKAKGGEEAPPLSYELQFCVRFDLNSNDGVHSIVFHETNMAITIDMSQGFTSMQISTILADVVEARNDAFVDYEYEVYQCQVEPQNINNNNIINNNIDPYDSTTWLPLTNGDDGQPPMLKQGSVLTMCYKTTSEIVQPVEFQYVTLAQQATPDGTLGGSATPITETFGADFLTTTRCHLDTCFFRTMLLSRFFEQRPSPNPILVLGSVAFEFINTQSPPSNTRRQQTLLQRQTANQEEGEFTILLRLASDTSVAFRKHIMAYSLIATMSFLPLWVVL